jgi:hypothetical protein
MLRMKSIKHQSNIYIIVGVCFLLIIGIVSYFYKYFFIDSNSFYSAIVTEDSKNFSDKKEGQQKFISVKNGLSIVASLETMRKESISITESENKIYVSICSNQQKADCFFKDGQYIEMFRKKNTDSLSESIKKTLLKKSDQEICVVSTEESIPLPDKGQNKSDYIVVRINIAGMDLVDDYNQYDEKLKNCPAPYSRQNGNAYFIMSKNRPDRFYFINLEQAGIPAGPDFGNDGLWQDNIEIL